MLSWEERVEELQSLSKDVHAVRDEMTDLITSADLDLAERCIDHALHVLGSPADRGGREAREQP